jgi:hypothetical protein
MKRNFVSPTEPKFDLEPQHRNYLIQDEQPAGFAPESAQNTSSAAFPIVVYVREATGYPSFVAYPKERPDMCFIIFDVHLRLRVARTISADNSAIRNVPLIAF